MVSVVTNLIVLSNEEQYRLLLENGFKPEDFAVFCDNPSFYQFLKDKKINFTALEDELLREYWDKINLWASEKALLWPEAVKEEVYFSNIELNKSLYVYFSYYLVSFIKNYLYAEFLYKNHKPEQLVVYENVLQPTFPRFNGNYFLNIILRSRAGYYGSKAVILSQQPAIKHCAHKSLKEGAKCFFKHLYALSFKVKKNGKADTYLVSGSLRHLDRIMQGLKKQGKNILLYGYDFNLEQLLFCLRHGINYLIPECLQKFAGWQDRQDRFNFKKDFLRLLESLQSRAWFSYEESDLSGILCDEISKYSNDFLEDLRAGAGNYSKIGDLFNIKALVVDEDLTPKTSFMAAFFKSRGIKIFCISHALSPIKFSLKPENRIFQLSDTFVHSEYEKSIYLNWGWLAGHLFVTGIPRFDKLLELKEIHSKRHVFRRKMKIMYCGTTMREYCPTHVSFMGIRKYDVGAYMRRYLLDTLKAISRYSIELVVRPHDLGDAELWFKFINQHKGNNSIRFSSPKRGFFKLLSECDAIILGYWSTAALEGLIFGIPTVVINYSGVEDHHPFAKENLCFSAKSPIELENIVKQIHQAYFEHKTLKEPVTKTNSPGYYLGLNDGNNTKRVIKHILENTIDAESRK